MSTIKDFIQGFFSIIATDLYDTIRDEVKTKNMELNRNIRCEVESNMEPNNIFHLATISKDELIDFIKRMSESFCTDITLIFENAIDIDKNLGNVEPYNCATRYPVSLGHTHKDMCLSTIKNHNKVSAIISITGPKYQNIEKRGFKIEGNQVLILKKEYMEKYDVFPPDGKIIYKDDLKTNY